ncbi:potassium channel family protein [Rappaport israeli]|uniref:potassium channel family protein n=1 Tax=Rappaport israeli TaxID=1839807 RepID=UPI000931066C|nr:potassium channel protein [Rappaport israeli]
MNEIVALIIRQMRRPVLVLVCAYAVAILGMSYIPMIGEDGEMTYLTVFQAFYWVSYTATTIGYGEIPVPFSDWQRLWVAFSIYYTVPAWLYAAGKIIGLLQDKTFQLALQENRFMRRVEKLRHKFVIICGFGEPGKRLVELLLKEGYQCVVIDHDETRINKMVLDASLHHVLSIRGDASDVDILLKSGIHSVFCRAVLAITDSESVNIKVALAAKLLSSDHTKFKIICRTFTRRGTANAKSFGTDIVVNTNQIFAERFTIGLRRPAIAELIARFYETPGNRFQPLPQPPAGRWIICGYDALGKTLERFLNYEGVDTVIINDDDAADHIQGIGTEDVTLREARIERAQAIVAARNSDSENLSIVMSAKMLHPSLFVIGKQNRSTNNALFTVAGFDRVMEEADLIVSQVFPQIARPMTSRLITLIRHQNEQWGERLLQQIQTLSGEVIPEQFIIRITPKGAPAVMAYLQKDHILRLQTLWMLSDDADTINDALPLLLLRKGKEILLPKPATNLQEGDQILVIYHNPLIAQRIRRALSDEAELFYAIHGREMPRSYVMNYILKKLD